MRTGRRVQGEVHRTWIVLAALVFGVFCPPVMAANMGGAADPFVERILMAQVDRITDFDISTQNLNDALLEFAVQARIQIFYDTEIPRTLRTSGLRGRYLPEDALRRLLAGTGLGYTFASPFTVTIGAVIPATPESLNSGPAPVDVTVGQAQLDTLFIEADPLGTESENMAVRTILMTDEDITRGGFRSLFDVLQGIEGLYIPLGEGAKQSFPSVTIRGLGSGYFGRTTPVIFLMNGHNMTGTWGSYFSFADLMLVPASMIQRVEVIKGSFSSIYGSGALGGVINIVTRQRFEGAMRAHAEISVGSEEYLNYEGRIDGRFRHLNWVLWAARSESDSRKYYEEDWQQVYGEIGEGTTDMNNAGLSALVDFPDGDSMHVLLAHQNRSKNLSDGRFYGDEQYATTVLQTKYASPIGDKLNAEFYLHYHRSDDWEPMDFGNGVPVPLGLGDPHYVAALFEYGPSEVWGFKGLFNLRAGRHALTHGLEYRHQRTWWAHWAGDREILRGWTEGWQDIYSAFIEDTISTGRLVVTPSLRVDHWKTWADVAGPERIDVPWDGSGTPPGNTVSVLVGKLSDSSRNTSVDPKLRAAYFLNDAVKLRGAAGTTFRAPTALEVYNYDYSTVQDYLSNTGLKPERVHSVELGADGRLFDEWVALSGTVFYTQARDRIEFAPDPLNPNAKRFQNLDSNIYGAELALKTRIAGDLTFSASGALTRSRYDGGPFDGLDVPLIPDIKANIALDYARGGISARVSADFIGERTIVNDPSVADTGFPITIKDGAYTLVDASVRYERRFRNDVTGFISLWGKNLLDESYMVDGFFVYQEPFGLPNFAPISQGRTFYATVGMDL